VRKKLIANLDPWIASASVSLIAFFASGIIQDKVRVIVVTFRATVSRRR